MSSLQELSFNASSRDDKIKFLLIFGKGLTGVRCYESSIKNRDGTLSDGLLYALPEESLKYDDGRYVGINVFEFVFIYNELNTLDVCGVVFKYTNDTCDDLYMDELAFHVRTSRVYLSSTGELCEKERDEYSYLPPRIIMRFCPTCGHALNCENNCRRIKLIYDVCRSTSSFMQHFKQKQPFVFETEYTPMRGEGEYDEYYY